MRHILLKIVAVCVLGSVAAESSAQYSMPILRSAYEGSKEACLKDHSRAWCIYDAAGKAKVLKDTSRRDVERQLQANAGENGGGIGILDVAMLGGTAAGFFRPPPGFSAGGAAGMLLLGLLAGDAKPENTHSNFLFGWMPYELAATPQEVIRKVLGLVEAANQKVFAAFTFEEITVPAQREAGEYSLDRLEYPALLVKGGECDEAECILVQHRMRYGDYLYFRTPKERTAPEYLGGYKAWYVEALPFRELRINGTFVSQSYLGRASKELPAWLFVSVTSQSTGDLYLRDINKGQKIPLLFNEGRPMATIFPEMEIAVEQPRGTTSTDALEPATPEATAGAARSAKSATAAGNN